MPHLTSKPSQSWIFSVTHWALSSFREPGLSNHQGKHWVHTKSEKERDTSWPWELAAGKKTQPVRKEFLSMQLPTASAHLSMDKLRGLLKGYNLDTEMGCSVSLVQIALSPVTFWVFNTQNYVFIVTPKNSCFISICLKWAITECYLSVLLRNRWGVLSDSVFKNSV